MLSRLQLKWGGGCILGCFGPSEAGGLRSTTWVAEYAISSAASSDLVNVIAFHLGVQKIDLHVSLKY